MLRQQQGGGRSGYVVGPSEGVGEDYGNVLVGAGENGAVFTSSDSQFHGSGVFQNGGLDLKEHVCGGGPFCCKS